MRNTLIHLALLGGVFIPAAVGQTSKSQALKYPSIDEYLMPQASEIALTKSAAPANLSDHSTVKVLTASGLTRHGTMEAIVRKSGQKGE
jgi:hypothetical protein